MKSPYLKPNRQPHLENYVRYIATREGAEPAENSSLHLPATEKQQKLIRKLLKRYPDCSELYEHTDYTKEPTRRNADELIQRITETHAELFGDREKYITYIAERPRVEKISTHGLFTDEGIPISLDAVAHQVAKSQSNVWTHIISMRREDAERLGYNSADAWMQLLRSQRNLIAENMKIAPENFRWYAAFHNEGHHPHVHMVAYSVDPKEAYLSKVGIEKIKSSLAREIFRQDLISVYDRQTEHRDELRAASKERMAEIVAEINRGIYTNPRLEDLLLKLAYRLAATSGKKVYGYLKADVKALVDSVVDELAADHRLAQLYDLWYEQREAVLKTYTDEMPERVSLSQNKEFKPIKNAVIQEAMNLVLDRDPVEEPVEPDDSVQPDQEPNEPEDDMPQADPKKESTIPRENGQSFDGNLLRLYQNAKHLLERDTEHYDPDRAIPLLTAAAEQGYVWAQYRLGKLLLRGEDTEQDAENARYWLERAAAQDNEWAQYLLGKTLLRGESVEQDADRAQEYLDAAYRKGNRYAAYTLGKALLDGELLPQDLAAALERLSFSADAGFSAAQYVYGKHLYQSAQNVPAALRYLEAAAQQQNSYAAYLAAKIYLMEEDYKSVPEAVRLFEIAAENGNDYAEYQLGKLYLFGKEMPQNSSLALYWLNAAADHGNQYAAQLLRGYHSGSVWPCAMGALRLLQQLARAMQNEKDEQQKTIRQMKTERKLLQKIEEKKQAHGLKRG